jgi:peptide-methionine (S)-S-oxide reductase
MQTRSRILSGLVAVAVAIATFSAPARAATPPAAPTQTAVLAGGCFWGMEAVFGALAGVTQAMPGYAGGTADTAHYDMVSTGETGHAESVRVTFDPAKISYQQILMVYFTIAHDPTELDRQGPDTGSQYRSEIYTMNDEQRRIALATIKELTAQHRFSAPIVTKVAPYYSFFPAEAYHRNFVKRNPDYPYVVVNDLPKLAALKKDYPALVAAQ